LRSAPSTPPIIQSRWERCGLLMLALYAAASLLGGGVYRPRGMELSDPRFYVFPAIMLLPLITLARELLPRKASPR